MRQPRSNLKLAFFFVSLYSIAVETFLTRYFAVTNWAEYGYWIISMVMAGFALSGISLSLFESFFEKRSKLLISIIPPLLVVFTAAGLYWVSINQFNPLEFQNEVTWTSQLGNIFAYYAALLPIFFLLGLYIGLVYILNFGEISKIYAVNLVASAIGSVVILAGMYFADLFSIMAWIVPVLLVPVYFSIVIENKRLRYGIIAAGLLFCVGAEIWLISNRGMTFPFYKPITTPLNSEGNVIVKKMSLPDGYFLVLDNVTEFNSIDLSPNYKKLGAGAPPRSLGIYRDGRRVSSLVKDVPSDYSYLKGALDAFPYEIRKNGNVLLAGTNGGFRIFERKQLGAAHITALETDPTIHDLVKRDVLDANGIAADGEDLLFAKGSTYSYLQKGDRKFDIIEYSSEYIGSSDNNKFSFTLEGIERGLTSLSSGGILSIPVGITEFPVYAVRLLETVREALMRTGAEYPGMNILVYRSNWTARILVSNKPFSESDIAALVKFCDERSFDTSYYPGIDPEKVAIYNDLPAISFDDVTSSMSDKASDSIMIDAIGLLGKKETTFIADNFFNLSPSTIDRPSFFSILRPGKLSQVLEKRSILPQEEIGYLVNIFILVQAVILAVIILLLPLIRLRSLVSEKRTIPKIMVYFACLGLGFLFIEMALIERFSLFLGNSTASFSIVLAGMLIFSGAGSYYSSRFTASPVKGVLRAVALIAVSVILYIAFLFPLIQGAGGLPFAVKGIIVLLTIAPVSFALGMPFPLGLSSLREHTGALLPWAWAINGAFSVISTPLANIISVSKGFTALFVISIALYAVAFVTFPGRRRT
jgi:hypothetical protein